MILKSINRQDEMQEVLLLHRKRQGIGLLMLIKVVNELESTAVQNNVYRVAKQMAKSRQDVVGVNCKLFSNSSQSLICLEKVS